MTSIVKFSFQGIPLYPDSDLIKLNKQLTCIHLILLPVFLSSSLMQRLWPLAETFNLPVQSGSSNFHSAALKHNITSMAMRVWTGPVLRAVEQSTPKLDPSWRFFCTETGPCALRSIFRLPEQNYWQPPPLSIRTANAGGTGGVRRIVNWQAVTSVG